MDISAANCSLALLLGRHDEALAVYLAGRRMSVEGYGTWDEMALKGIAKLRSVGITHPQMAEIEALITAGR